MSENWLSPEDNPCHLVCFFLLQLPQLCLSSIYLSYDLLLLSMTPDHHITLMMDNGHSVSLSSEQNPQGHLTISSSSHHMYCPLSWYKEMFLFESTALQHLTFLPHCLHPHWKQPDVNSGPGGSGTLPPPPPPPGQLCLAQPAFYCFAKARMDSPPLPW